jgi:anaerobic ribonucleoside-triphosphate reductase activating protein
MSEIVFILEPDTGRVTVESSQADVGINRTIQRDLGTASVVNCARPQLEVEKFSADIVSDESQNKSLGDSIYLYRIYHHSTVDGPGRRSVVQVAGCSIRCAGCYVPETHERANGTLTSIEKIISEIDKRSGEHDGVTILGGEPFDQTEGLLTLVEKLKAEGYHLVIYSGYTFESLLARRSGSINRILAVTDLLVDGRFVRELSAGAGEYRGSRNQRLIFHPILRQKMSGDGQAVRAKNYESEREKSEADFIEFMEICLDEGWSPTRCPKGCVVEPEGVCPHDFKSVALEYGLV